MGQLTRTARWGSTEVLVLLLGFGIGWFARGSSPASGAAVEQAGVIGERNQAELLARAYDDGYELGRRSASGAVGAGVLAASPEAPAERASSPASPAAVGRLRALHSLRPLSRCWEAVYGMGSGRSRLCRPLVPARLHLSGVGPAGRGSGRLAVEPGAGRHRRRARYLNSVRRTAWGPASGWFRIV